jgi:glutamyl-tRNA synthetase
MSRRPVVTRFAPSPTGFLHIGGARTALFNQLYARHTGGTFLLRVEDTDRERSTDAAVAAIFEGLSWLGVTPDAEPVFQHARADRHREAVMQLLEAGKAYRCYLTVAELEAMREQARAEGRAIRSPWRDREPTDPGAPHVIRFRGPLEGETVLHDLVKGEIRFRNIELDDLVLLRSDGAPTYNLAVVVDDHDMGVTHIIRGDDHVNNAARQTLIYQAFGWDVPAMGHIPLIHGPDGAKLSKRHGAQAVGEFADMGYLPEAMRNYLTRLGWGHGDDEIFTDEQAIAWFDVVDVVKSPARLDWQKLGFINAHYLKEADNSRLAGLVSEALKRRGQTVPPRVVPRMAELIGMLKEGAKTVLDIADALTFVLNERPLTLDDRTRGMLTPEVTARLGRLRTAIAGATFEKTALEGMIRAFAEAEGVGIGKFGPALRGVLSGGAAAPDLATLLLALEPAESLARLDDALAPGTASE